MAVAVYEDVVGFDISVKVEISTGEINQEREGVGVYRWI